MQLRAEWMNMWEDGRALYVTSSADDMRVKQWFGGVPNRSVLPFEVS